MRLIDSAGRGLLAAGKGCRGAKSPEGDKLLGAEHRYFPEGDMFRRRGQVVGGRSEDRGARSERWLGRPSVGRGAGGVGRPSVHRGAGSGDPRTTRRGWTTTSLPRFRLFGA